MTTAPTAVEDTDVQELRFALVMNGGVSLAIWMGGVTKEIDRVRRRDGAYGRLATLLAVEPRVDVIAGASAGGINGALLALAMARGTNTDNVRDLWMQHGSIEPLLREPLTKDPPSIFQGDEYFLPRLRDAMQQLAGKNGDGGVDHPLHLAITGTAMTPEVKGYADHFGIPIPDKDHRVLFTFRRGPVGESPPPGGTWPDDFARAAGRGDLPVERLALAARTTASFPAAFEPSWIPVDADDDVEYVDGRPNMGPVAPALTASRWLIDGGVLVNTPFRPALDAVATLEAHRPVRRVMAYVVPNLGDVLPVPADERKPTPTPIQVALAALSRLPRTQSIGRELEEIEDNNVRVQRRRRSRRCLLRDLDPAELEQMAASLYQSYVCFRRETAADDIVQLVLDATYHDGRVQGRTDSGDPIRKPAGVRDPKLLADLQKALARIAAPWLPPGDQKWVDVTVGQWTWGVAPVENAANVTLDVLRRAVGHLLLAENRAIVTGLREECHAHLAELRAIGRASQEYWREHAPEIVAAARDGADDERLQSIVVGWGYGPELGRVASAFADILVRTFKLVDAAQTPPASELGQLLRTLCSPNGPGIEPRDLTLRRLLALDVVQRASGADLAGVEQEIELVLMSADASNSFDVRHLAEDKLAGLQAHHFGSFYKSSWRANDWMWGRLDGADRLVRTMVDPRRIFQLLREQRVTVDEFVRGIREIACGGDLSAWLTDRWTEGGDEAAVRAEITAIPADEPPPASTTLPRTYDAIRRRVQLEILRDEVPAVRAAVAVDRRLDTARDTAGTRWADGLAPAPLDAQRLADAFKSCTIGKEQIADEVGSDYFTKISTRTVAVATAALRTAIGGVKLAGAVLTPVRGVAVALYLLGRGVLEGSRTGRFAVAVSLALGGALIALWALVPAVPGALPLLGVTLLSAAVLLSVIRLRLLRALAILGVMALITAGYYAYDRLVADGRWNDRVAEALAVLLFVILAALLGMVGRGTRKTR